MKNTAVQEAINKIDTLIAMWQDHSNEMDFEHTLKTYKSELESLLEKEKQDLIDAFKSGYQECERDELNIGDYADFEDYYKQNFEK